MLFSLPFEARQLEALALATAIGLLMGLERERRPAARAGVPTIMVSGGFGTTLLPESILNLRLPNVVYRPLVAEVECMIDLHCAYRKDEESPLLDELLECVRTYIHQGSIVDGDA